MAGFVKAANKVMLIILDGWGLSPNEHGNAPLLAKTPTLDYVYATYPKTSLSASGIEVGLSPGEPGNSEVGHANIGSGRVVWENLSRINQAIQSGEVFTNQNLQEFVKAIKERQSSLHFIGLVSDGGVHSHIDHLLQLIRFAAESGLKDIYVHLVSDGRDTEPKKVELYAEQLESAYKKYGAGKTATMIGRYFAMDRDNNWDRVKKAYDLFVSNTGQKYPTIKEAISGNYAKDKSDEFIEPSVIGDGGVVKDGDGIIFFNHRSDRMRQMVAVFSGLQEGFIPPKELVMLSMTQYQKDQKVPVIFNPVVLDYTLPEIIAQSGLTQYHTAETEKFAHVTYFFAAGKEMALSREKDEVVPSKKNLTYDKIPEMSAYDVTGKVKSAIEQAADFIVVNYANGDMVGHTGVLESAIKACESVDTCLADILKAASNRGYKAFITADHGNCEVMIDDLTKEPNKEHTTNPVPFVYLDFQKRPFEPVAVNFALDDYIQYAVGTPVGVLADIAPSILANLGLPKADQMSGMDLSVAMV